MKFFSCTALLLCFLADRALSQTPVEANPCATVMPQGTLASIEAWVTSQPAAKTTSFTDTVALTVHIVGTDAGAGYYPVSNLWKLICQTNERFQSAGIYFQLQLPVRYINNSDYYVHDFFGGYDMISTQNVSGTVNAYFVQDASGACGYFMSGADGVVIANMCAGNNSTTLTHELGHFMGLPHTFNGWEGGTPPSIRERVIRTGPQANCSFACDGFCDTDADFVWYRWPCPLAAVMYDDLGVRYRPDSSLYMSYSSDVCQSRFSAQQIGYMQNVLHSQRVDLLQYTPHPFVALDTPSMNYPIDTMWANDRTIRWAAVPGADFYHVVLKRGSGMLLKDTIVTGTSYLTTHPVAPYNRYVVTITPMASSNICGTKSRVQSYYYSPSINPLLTIEEEASMTNSNIQLFPNPAGADGWTIRIPAARRGAMSVTLLAPDGRIVRKWNAAHTEGMFTQAVGTSSLADGLYFIRVEGEGLQWAGRAALSR